MDSKRDYSTSENTKIRSHRHENRSNKKLSRSRSRSCDSSHRSHYRSDSSKRQKHSSKNRRDRSQSREESPDRRKNVSKDRYEHRRHRLTSRGSNRKYDSLSEESCSESSGSEIDIGYYKSSGGRDPRDKSKREVWNNKVCILGEKVTGFKMHFCRSCDMPIIRYARLAPCKHVFCLTCGFELLKKTCRACHQPVESVSQYEFGSLFVCEMKSCNSSDGLCHRGYYSARDLEAHHDFRHKSAAKAPNGSNKTSSIGVAQAPSLLTRNDPNNLSAMRNPSNPPPMPNMNMPPSGPMTSSVLTFNNPMAAINASGPLSNPYLTNPTAAQILMGISSHNVNTSVNLLSHFHASTTAPRPF